MVQTRSRTRTHQSEVVEVAPKPSRSKSAIGGKSSPLLKAKEVSRKRCLQQNDETLSTPALKKSRPNAKKKTADKPKAKQRTRSVSKPRTIYHEVREMDVKEPIEKPQRMRTRSSSRSQSIHLHTNGRGINGVNTETQRKMHIEDSTDKFYSDTMSIGDRENDSTIVDLLVQESNSAVENLIDACVDLTDINLCSEHSVPRKIVPDYKEATDKPQSMRTRSRSRSRSVYHEICEEEEPDVTPKKEDIPPNADQLLPNADASMTAPTNHNTSDEMKEAALLKSQTIEHYSTAYPYTPQRYMGHSRWSHHYYDSHDSQFKDPMILCSDRLYDDDDEFHFEQDELDKESILPTPKSSLDTSSVSSEDDIKYSRPKEAAEKKESTSFFKNFCSFM